MIVHRHSVQDAIQVYTLTIAFLHDAKIHNHGPITPVCAKEVKQAVYYIWSRERPPRSKQRIAPVAVCSYDNAARTWEVELITGETLTLVDKGTVWDVTTKKRRQDAKIPNAANVPPARKSKRAHPSLCQIQDQ